MLGLLILVGVFTAAAGLCALALKLWSAQARLVRVLAMACLACGCVALWYWIGLIEPFID